MFLKKEEECSTALVGPLQSAGVREEKFFQEDEDLHRHIYQHTQTHNRHTQTEIEKRTVLPLLPRPFMRYLITLVFLENWYGQTRDNNLQF